jgi:uncharacterized membrane protein YgaE (UPF0421/DUF939 family)
MSVWDRATVLERTLSEYIRQAQEYQDNTFSSHPGYYIDYFEMRKKQCIVLHNLHYEMRRIRTMPRQAHIISDYILYMAEYVVEVNIPEKQLTRLEEIFDSMRKQPLPSTHDDFESRAILYHILMDLEEFLFHKKKFVENMDETQMKVYWEKA